MAKTRKMPIGWHEDCLRNARDHIQDEEKRLREAQKRVHKLRIDADFYERQIAEAKRRKLTDFDCECFMHNSRPDN